MISVIKHVADQQPQPRLAPPAARSQRLRSRHWARMALAGTNTTGAGSCGAAPAGTKPTHAFICYKHSEARARGVLAQLSAVLSQAQRLFCDQPESPNLDWAERLAREIKRSDVVIAVLSNQSIASEMVEAELALARDTATPQIFVLRLPASGPPPYPLRHYLDRVDDLVFSGDVQELAADLRRAVAGIAAPARPRRDTPAAPSARPTPNTPPPLPWANPEPPARGSEPASTLYVERPADTAALQAIRGQGVTLAITGARQVGKSSLLARTTAEARRQGKSVLTLDFQLFERPILADPDRFFRYLCEAAGAGLGVESRVDAFWGNLGNSYNCTRYFEYLLEHLNAPLVLALDKLERLPNTTLRSSFFSMLRAWCDSRATSAVWGQFDLLLATSSEAHQLVESACQSPFNTGLTIALDDFTADQVADLNERHGRPFAAHDRQTLIELLAGHPYLIRQALYLAAAGLHTPAEIIGTAANDEGPFADHLRYHLFKLSGQTLMLAELRHVIGRGASVDAWAFDELRAAGLVRREGERAMARCRLYDVYFQKHLL